MPTPGPVASLKARLRITKFVSEFGHDFFPNLITANADAGSYGGDEIRRSRAEVFLQGRNAVLDDSPTGPAPPGVQIGHYWLPRVDQKNRQAVGRLNAQQVPRTVGHQAVALADPAGVR